MTERLTFVLLCAKPAERPWDGATPSHAVEGRLPCNRERGHPGTCSAKGQPVDDGSVRLRRRPDPA